MNTSFITVLSAATEPGRIIGFDVQLLFDLAEQWFATMVIVFILYKLLFKPATDFLDKRKVGIAKNIDDANKSKVEAIELKKNYESKLAKIEDEANQILKDTRAKALLREEQIIKEAKEEAENIKRKALDDIKLEQERIKDELKKEMIEVSTIMASKFVSASIDETKQNEMIDDIIKEMGDVQWLS
ncbi:ATP synthase F0 subunit B [Sporanaerobium hydrogeniformans]|uniref:ATP synthase F0 subunit B n=1 Tax=Sporanaerobium hydrogeniformans TaxID=3072179 RepID=A0AC61DAB8_9FIRM|nr:F0F1 ATP synthase subunit B [Sporanaerobium hydrogeniformans]PHV69860.1 ATP synthase F0 subunit B [Sporanaerobium hydrogeniformans]